MVHDEKDATLTLDASVQFKGRVHWQLVDRDGNVAQEGHQDNLILNSGLDRMATINPMDGAFRNYLAVGTGTAAPVATQTSLANELYRSNMDGVNTATSPTDIVTDTGGVRWLHGTFTLSRIIDFNFGNGNLTEFGFGDTTSTSNLNIRELFRDGNGNPVVITKTNEYQLKVIHSLEYFVGPLDAVSASVTITGLNGDAPIAGKGLVYYSNLASVPYLVTPGTPYYGSTIYLASTRNNITTNAVPEMLATNNLTIKPYTAGTFTLVKETTFPTTVANGTIYGFGYYIQYYNASIYTGFKFTFDTFSFTKTSANRLTVSIRVTWGRKT